MTSERPVGKPRIAEPVRNQGTFRFERPEDALPPTHPARVLWEVTGTLDLSRFLVGIKAVEGPVGRRALSPRMKLTLWLYGVSQGIGSARQIARLALTDRAYRWIVGSLEVKHDTLSGFHRCQGAALDGLMTDILASTTDAQARVMKMADGGFRPAYNVRMATAGSPLGGPRTLVGVQVCNVGSDMGAITPMLDEIERRTGRLPKVLLADANHAKHECLSVAAERGVEAIVAVPERSRRGGPHASADPAVVAWRERMETEDAKRLYRARASLCELSNAHLGSHHGVDHFLVRGLAAATNVVLLGAIASNLLQHAAALLG